MSRPDRLRIKLPLRSPELAAGVVPFVSSAEEMGRDQPASMRSLIISLVLALAGVSTACAAPYAVYFAGWPNAVPALQHAVDDVRSANKMIAGGDDVGGRKRLRVAATSLERAAADPRTYTAHAESNVTGVIENATAVGSYLDAHGDRRFANVAWRAAIRAYDRSYSPRDASERRIVALFSAHRYREAFAVYASWLRSYGFSPTVDDAEQAAFTGGLAAATQGRWEDAEAGLSTIGQIASCLLRRRTRSAGSCTRKKSTTMHGPAGAPRAATRTGRRGRVSRVSRSTPCALSPRINA